MHAALNVIDGVHESTSPVDAQEVARVWSKISREEPTGATSSKPINMHRKCSTVALPSSPLVIHAALDTSGTDRTRRWQCKNDPTTLKPSSD